MTKTLFELGLAQQLRASTLAPTSPLARSDFRFKKFEQKKHEQIHIVHPIRN